MNRSIVTRAGAVALTGIAMLGVAGPALANDADVIRRGNCSGRADWKLKASPEDGRIEVEGEVDSNVNGQTWKWRMLHNGNVSARGTATTMVGCTSCSSPLRPACGLPQKAWRRSSLRC